jgi:hypothetical protein
MGIISEAEGLEEEENMARADITAVAEIKDFSGKLERVKFLRAYSTAASACINIVSKTGTSTSS